MKHWPNLGSVLQGLTGQKGIFLKETGGAEVRERASRRQVMLDRGDQKRRCRYVTVWVHVASVKIQFFVDFFSLPTHDLFVSQ